MKIKTYQRIKLGLVVVLAVTFSQAIIIENFVIPIALLLVGSLILLYLRKQVDEIIADERDWTVAGKSALLAMQIFSWIGVVAMFAFNSMANTDPCYLVISRTLAFAVMFLMLTYVVVYRVKMRKGVEKR